MIKKRNILKTAFVLGFTLSVVACNANAKNKEIPMKKFTDQPYVSLDINGEGCPFTIMVNDIPVYMQYDFEPMLVEQPINQYLTNGENKISVQVSYAVDDDGHIVKDKTCKVSVDYLIKAKGSDDQYNLGKLVYSATSGTMLNNPDQKFIAGSTSDKFLAIENNKVESVKQDQAQFQIGNPVIKADDQAYYGYDFDTEIVQPNAGASVTNTLNLQLPYDNKVLTEGEILENNETTRQELIEVYKQIISDIGKKDFVALKSMFEPVMKNNSVSLYLPENQTNVLVDIEETAKDPDHKIASDINYTNSVLSIFAKNTLATLTWWNDESFLGFNKIGKQGSTTYKLIFAKINGKWKVVL